MAKRARAQRREAERATEKLGDQRERLAKAEPGGSAKNPIELGSASQVEPYALGLGCARCGQPTRLDDHSAEEIDGSRLRVVRMRCITCGTRRTVFVRLVTKLLN